MPTEKSLIIQVAKLLVICAVLSAAASVWAASREKVIWSFAGNAGSCPHDKLIFDKEGNLYGTTFSDGIENCYDGEGTVFKLSPEANGKWAKTVLHRFHGNDGANPFAGLIFDGKGNLYGTTWVGGTACEYGCGTVFRLSPGTNGEWTQTVLHSFNGYPGGSNPYGEVIFDAAGKLYGTTWSGGLYGCGNIYQLTPKVNGYWTERVLHTFNCIDGNITYPGLVFDKEGSLYGASTSAGNSPDCSGSGCGSVFKLSPSGSGEWKYTVIHYFHGRDGAGPEGTLIFDPAGNLYGTTAEGGYLNTCYGHGCGTVFKLSPAVNGKWTETVLHRFNGNDGAYPDANLIFDNTGSLYSTTTGTGTGTGKSHGTVFKLAPGRTNGRWTETILHRFNSKDGAGPDAGLIFDSAGNLYGTTYAGGDLNVCVGPDSPGCGVVFEIEP